ncbi:hypothetical protein D9M69_556940 [compost metagenome]
MVAFSIRRQRSQGRRRPGAAPGNPTCGAWPRPNSVKRSHISRDSSFSEIIVIPILLDLRSTPATSSVPLRLTSLIVLPWYWKRPLPVSNSVLVVMRPRSNASAAVNGFMIEPGSKVSVMAWLRSLDPWKVSRLFGSNVGTLASARISPVCTSTTTAVAPLAWCLSMESFRALNTKYCRRVSIDRRKSRPSTGKVTACTSSITRPSRSLMTRRLPGRPESC